MVRIVEDGSMIYHHCMNCGIEVVYYSNSSGYCHICKKSQMLKTSDGFTSVPFDFLLGASFFIRTIYHTEKTDVYQEGETA